MIILKTSQEKATEKEINEAWYINIDNLHYEEISDLLDNIYEMWRESKNETTNIRNRG